MQAQGGIQLVTAEHTILLERQKNMYVHNIVFMQRVIYPLIYDI